MGWLNNFQLILVIEDDTNADQIKIFAVALERDDAGIYLFLSAKSQCNPIFSFLLLCLFLLII